MKKALQITLIVIAILAVAGGIFFTGTLFARAGVLRPQFAAADEDDLVANAGRGAGPGRMMGRGGGGGMMGGYGANNVDATPLTLEQAKSAAETYLAAIDNPDLKISEIMIFDNNAYVVVSEKSTGLGAFELLVDPLSQTAYPEHGPNMMWNLKYSGLNHQYMMGGGNGMMGGRGGHGMMGGYGANNVPADVSAQMTITPEKAVTYAQAFLDANLPGATAADDPLQFYGYYTLDYEQNGTVAGMLSVNGFSGQIFLHTWHGTFIEEIEY